MAHWAAKGVKCSCVRPFDHSMGGGNLYDGPLPVLGRIYTIAGVEEALGLILIVLDEFDPNLWFVIEHFRPVVDEEDDIAMFRVIADQALSRKTITITEPA